MQNSPEEEKNVLGQESKPPKHRRGPLIEYELFPANASWLDLMPPNAGRSARLIFACLEYGVLEAWQDGNDTVRLYLPEAVGGHVIVAGPDDDLPAPDLMHCDPGRDDPDALVRRDGAEWITLLPSLRRSRTRPQPRLAAHHGEAEEVRQDP